MANMLSVEPFAFLSGIFGLILAVLALFVSIVWIIFPFIVMGRMRLLQEEIQTTNRNLLLLIQETSKGNQSLTKVANSTAQKASPPQPRGESPKLNISKGGEDLGRMDAASVRSMLKKGEITLQDHYFDTVSNEWVTLDCHPEFC